MRERASRIYAGEGGLTSVPPKVSGERSLSDKQRQGAIAVARSGRTGSNVSLRRVSTVATHEPLCGFIDGLCLRFHFVEF
jgi:hypothetical protein